MKTLKLNFLDNRRQKQLTVIEEILHQVGEQITQYAKEYFNFIVTTTSVNNQVTEASLYLLVPEIGYNYKIMSLEFKDKDVIEVRFYTLKTKQIEPSSHNIAKGLEELENRIAVLFETKLVDATFRFLVDQVDLKRESRSE